MKGEKKRQIKEIKMKSCRAMVNKYFPEFSHLAFFEEGLVGCFALFKKKKKKSVVFGCRPFH